MVYLFIEKHNIDNLHILFFLIEKPTCNKTGIKKLLNLHKVARFYGIQSFAKVRNKSIICSTSYLKILKYMWINLTLDVFIASKIKKKYFNPLAATLTKFCFKCKGMSYVGSLKISWKWKLTILICNYFVFKRTKKS